MAVTKRRPVEARTKNLQAQKPRRPARVIDDPARRQEILNRVYAYARAGYTDVEIASSLGVTYTTLNKWTEDDPELLLAMQPNRDAANLRVAGAMYRKALGGCVVGRQVVSYRNGEPEILEEEISYTAPDNTAMIFYLKNRDPKNWRDVKQIEADVEHKGLSQGTNPVELAQAVLAVLSEAAHHRAKVIEHE